MERGTGMHGEGNWNAVQKHSGLSQCGKSYRLRWANHLRPNLKKGAFTSEEEHMIIELHAKIGNKWTQMAAHGKTRPTHYHVLYDEIGFSADDLQELEHSLSDVYQRSTSAISVVAPICYAHLAAAQVGQFMKFEEMSETSSGQGGVTAAGQKTVQELPKLHANVSSSMFFC